MKARLLQNDMVPKNVEFLIWDIEKGFALYADSVFNCIFSFHTVNLFNELENVIREYFRVLKPYGGVILAGSRCMDKHHPMLEFDEEQLRVKLENAGFRINVIKTVASEIIATAVKPRYHFEANSCKFLIAETREDLEKVWSLLYRVYCMELGVEPKDPSGFLKDEYDEYSTHFLALDENNRAVGTIRVVPENPKGFPMDADFALTEYMRANGISSGVEGGRFVIRKDVTREARSTVAFGLFKCLVDYCRETGVNDVFTTTMLEIVQKYNMPGFKQIGEPFRYPEPLSRVLWVPMHCDLRMAYKNYLKSSLVQTDTL